MGTLSAQQPSLRLTAPARVVCGEEFKIQYVVNTSDAADLSEPKFPSAFNVLYGPSRSVMSSYQIINGKQSSSSSVTYTYLVSIEKAGTYTVPAATAKVKGKQIASNSMHITALPAEKESKAQPATPQTLSGKDLFIQVNANKAQVYEQEPVVLTYKVYTRVNLRQLGGKMPDLKGFLVQEVPVPQQKTFRVENYNGRNYQSALWSQYVMFPQQSGKLVIPSIKFEGLVEFPVANDDFFDNFFDGGGNYTQVKKVLNAPSVTINVKKLPLPKPQNFSGAVGRLDIAARVLNKDIKTNENLNFRVSISGVGNMKLIQAPKLNLSPDFDVYNPSVTNNTKLTAEGIKGSMVYDYIIIPKKEGDYEIPAIEFVYFDSESKTYVTKRTKAQNIHVAKGRELTLEEQSLGRQDIRDIHSRRIDLRDVGESTTSGNSVWGGYLIILLLGCGAFGFLLRRRRNGQNENIQMRKRANKTSQRYLKSARKQMKHGNKVLFYQEISNALRAYASNRLSIPMSEYTLERVCAVLSERSVPESLTDEFRNLVSLCEYIRYAPESVSRNAGEIYAEAEKLISNFEDVLK